jgi:hypothetical protein
MRRIITTCSAAAVLLAAVPSHAQDARAEEVLRAAREALGGADRISSIRTLLVTGKQRRTLGEMQMNGEVEISAALPDKYLRTNTDQIFGNSVSVEMGFSGDRVLQHSSSQGGGNAIIRIGGPGAPGPGGGPADPEAIKAALLRGQRADFARLMLGMTLTAPEYLDATFSYAGEAESPDGRAHVIDVTGNDNFRAKLFIDQESNRPLMLTYMGALPQVRVVRGERGPDGPPPERRAEEAERQVRREPPQMVEMQVYFDEYRKVGDVWLPHHITRASNGQTNEELEFEKIRVNTEIKPSTFEPK